MPKLMEIARVVRSKNAGPFWLTLDVMLPSQQVYDAVRTSGAINREAISRLYNVEADKVRIYEYAPAYAIKISIPRPVPAGDLLDTDVYATQQHAPLLDIEVPLEAGDR